MNANEKPERLSVVDSVTALFISPVKLMGNIKFYPVCFIPILICFFITGLYLPLYSRRTEMAFDLNEPAMRATYEQMGLDPDVVIEQARATTGSGGMSLLATAIPLMIGIPLSALLSAFGMLVVGKLFKSEATLKQYFSMYAYLQIIATLGMAVVTALNLSTRSTVNMLSLAALMPGGDAASAVDANYLGMALTSFSLPGLWLTALAIVGLKVINDWPTGKAVAVGILSFFLSVAATLLIAVIPSMLL